MVVWRSLKERCERELWMVLQLRAGGEVVKTSAETVGCLTERSGRPERHTLYVSDWKLLDPWAASIRGSPGEHVSPTGRVALTAGSTD